MRKEIRQRLVRIFRAKLESRFPQFVLLKRTWSGTIKIWGWHFAPEVFFFVAIQPFESQDRFALECAWNVNGEYPWRSLSTVVNLDSPCWRDRISTGANRGYWDATPEEGEATERRFEAILRGERVTYPLPPPVEVVLPRLDALVDDCLLQFEQKGLPILEQVAVSRGLCKKGDFTKG